MPPILLPGGKSFKPPARVDRSRQIVYLDQVITGLFRFVFFALLAYLIMAVVRAFRRVGPRREPEPPRKITGLMVKDEFCNTYLPKEQALREVRDGREHYFCSRECRDRFLAEKRPPA